MDVVFFLLAIVFGLWLLDMIPSSQDIGNYLKQIDDARFTSTMCE